MSDEKPDNNKDKAKFTVDSEKSGINEMPSITRLLNRKRLLLPDTYSEQPATEVDITHSSINVALDPPEDTKTDNRILSEIVLEAPVDKPQSPVAKKALRRPIQKKLVLWTTPMLMNGSDPLGKGLALMLERGATSALFLAVSPPPTGSPVPHFLASAAVAPENKLNIWTGLKWDPTVVPEMWNYFVKAGFVELAPPGTTTNKKSSRNVVRAAFGIDSDEWLLIVRAGSPKACRGVLALVSKKSLAPALETALPLITSSPPQEEPTKTAA